VDGEGLNVDGGVNAQVPNIFGVVEKTCS